MLDCDQPVDGLRANRFDRRGTISTREQSADGMHDAERGGARRKSKQQRMCGALSQTFQHAHRVAGTVMDQRVHRHDVVETSQRRDRACRRRETRCCRARGRAAAFPGQADQGRGQVDCDHTARRVARLRPPGRLCRSRRPECGRRGDPVAANSSSVRRMSSRPARTVARMLLTGASEVSRFQASTAVRSKYCSNSPRRAA